MKNKKAQEFTAIAIILLIVIVNVIFLFNQVEAKTSIAKNWSVQKITEKLYGTSETSINFKAKKQIQKDIEKTYAYNENVPEHVIINEIETLSKRFNLNAKNWVELVRCEATCTERDHKQTGCILGEITNLATNPKSTAVGTGQYLILTWYATESWKQERKARTDFKATLWEQGLDLQNGEQSKWQECLDITGLTTFNN